jgi:polysaccharide biosynthesis protein PslH
VNVVWASPAGATGFVEAFRRAFPRSRARFVLGINDATWRAYLDQAFEFVRGSIRRDVVSALRLARVPWIALHERRYLCRVDAVHVQTSREVERLQRILGRGPGPRIFAAPCGVDRTLLDLPYTGASTRDVLFMTHLEGFRAQQGLWFLRKVWPAIHRAEPDARLFLVGLPAPPPLAAEIDGMPGVVQCGFAPRLHDAFAGKAVSVVPVWQTSGQVTKVVDSMAAGVPVVGFSAVRTVDGFRPGVHAIEARSAGELASGVVRLLRDTTLRTTMSQAARAFIRDHCDWERTGDRVEQELERLVGDTLVPRERNAA